MRLFIAVFFSLNAFSAVDISTGDGGNWGGVPSVNNFPQPPESKRTYISHKVVTSITAECLDTNSRWGGNPLSDLSDFAVIGVPIINAENEKKYIAIEFPTSLVMGTTIEEFDNPPDDASEDTQIDRPGKVVVYEVGETWSDSYRDASVGTRLTNEDHINYQMSSGQHSLSIQFDSPSRHIKRIDKSRGPIFRQWKSQNTAPYERIEHLNIWFSWHGHRGGTYGVSYTPGPDGQKSGHFDINLKIPVKADTFRRVKKKRKRRRYFGFVGPRRSYYRWVRNQRAYGCRYYTSPLMVFFDDKRPQFTGLSSFPLIEGSSYVTWPEKKAPGYLVALDRNKDGKITEANELFGNVGVDVRYENGFESLKALDSNKDDKMNFKDKAFRNLVLWKDLNRNGVGEKEEQILLSKKIKEISLDYKKSSVNFGKRAKELQKSTFTYMKEGKKRRGHIADIWFTAVPENRVSADIKKAFAKKAVAKKMVTKKAVSKKAVKN